MKATQVQEINNALNQRMYEFVYRYKQDRAKTIYTTWATDSQFISCYPGTEIIRKR